MARVTKNRPKQDGGNPIFQVAASGSDPAKTVVYLDARYAQLAVSSPVVVQRNAPAAALHVARVIQIRELPTFVFADELDPNNPMVTVTRVELVPQLTSVTRPDELSFHFAFVDAGQVTLVNKVDLTPADLRTPGGVPITGVVETPPNAVGGELEQDFLIQDKDKKGALVHAKMTFDQGNATFQLLTELDLLPFDSFKTPITVYGNVVEASRGETVTNEVLGNGDPRLLHQQFKLRKKPLTYLAAPGTETGVKSTLVVRVAGVAWAEVKSFFDVGGTADQGEGFDMAVQAKGASADWSGMRAAWGDELEYIRLNGALDTEVATAQIVHRVHRAWHTMSLDADFAENAGIGTIDNLVNKESLSGTFGTTNQPAVSGPRLLARFGVTDNDESASGRLRNFVASAPGRFVRASFRGFATSSSMLLRLVFVADAGDASGQATFKVRYSSVASATFNPYDESTSTMHEATATVTVAAATDLNVIHIVNVTLSDGVTPNIPLWFSIERNPGDTLDQTIHLLEAVLSATPS